MFTAAQFHQRLSSICRENGTSITKFSKEILHISSSVPTNWKNGMIPNAEIAARCAQYFNVSADYLLGLTDTPRVLSASEPSSDEIAMLHALRAAPSSTRKAALAAMYAVMTAYGHAQEDEPVI